MWITCGNSKIPVFFEDNGLGRTFLFVHQERGVQNYAKQTIHCTTFKQLGNCQP